MKEGIVAVMLRLTREIPVTELLVQVISGQEQWKVEFGDEVQ